MKSGEEAGGFETVEHPRRGDQWARAQQPKLLLIRTALACTRGNTYPFHVNLTMPPVIEESEEPRAELQKTRKLWHSSALHVGQLSQG